ncbi:adenylate/guanylate cyclase domain-containing protein [Aquihabitans sp. McL0605]|uniref:adenylate/guanylate cyclase domain-containing protein n=1 Tax=Aquihabitans sp. McL0605 TaxID=3415671 RepID=UPI003CF69893
MTCSACGATAAADARFCASCGRPLRTVDDERRVVTVLFSDLVGFTSLSERLDPERVKNLVDRCFDRLAEDITSFGGQVDKIVGDALVALFGATTAHEDDPERAVRAALRMQATLCEEAEAIGQELQMRIGINTGEVLVGAMRAAGSVTAMGDVVNTASRLQTHAQPGEVLVGPATHAATQHNIAYEPRGLLDAKGRDELVETWVAVAPTLPPGYRARRVDVPLVGRAAEQSLLTTAIDSSIRHERALLCLLVADVGMGKSRLADEVASAAVETHNAIVREGRCVPYGEANVWWPVADALRSGLQVPDGANLAEARIAVREAVAATMERRTTDPEVQRTAEGLLTLLGYEPQPEADPITIRQEAGRALGAYAGASARRRPLVLQISDLHWADEAVLTLIDEVFGAIHHCPVVVLATARPALLDQWTPKHGRHNALTLHLDPLGREAAAELLEHLVGAPVPAVVSEALLDRSGGNPFFLEELVSLLDGEAVAEPGRVAALPDTLRGLVAARLDDLSPSLRMVLQDASVIGQRGPMNGLREMNRQLHRDLDLDAAMAELAADEIMEIEGDGWRFRSDLVREVAYQTITKAERAKCHLGIAHYIETKAEYTDPRPPWLVDQLAHHYGAAVGLAAELGPNARTDAFPADLADKARHWVTEAADRARRDQALPAAIRLYTQALDLLGEVDGKLTVDDADPESAALVAEAIRLHLARSSSAAEGWELALGRSDAEVALRLAEGAGDGACAAQALIARGTIEQKEGDIDAAIATMSAAADRFRELHDLPGLGEALRRRGMVEIFGNRVTAAELSAEAALAAFEEVGDLAGQGWASQNLAWAAFVSGRPDEADRRLQTAVSMFSDVVDTQGLAWSLGLLAWVRFQQGRVPEAQALGEQVLDEARARSDPWATAMMLMLVASIRLWSGRTDEAVTMAEQAQRTFTSLGDRYGGTQAGAVLGRALVMAGRVEEGFALLVRTGNPGKDAGVGDGLPARFSRLAAALQIGEPERGAAVLEEIEVMAAAGFGGDDSAAVLGAAALMAGDVPRALDALSRARTDSDPNVMAVQALAAAAAATGGAGPIADAVDGAVGATYLDRAIASSAAAIEAAAGDHGEAEAHRRITQARSAVLPTDDRVAKVIVEMAASAVADRLGLPEAEELAGGVEHQLARLGIDGAGWLRVFALASRAVPT